MARSVDSWFVLGDMSRDTLKLELYISKTKPV